MSAVRVVASIATFLIGWAVLTTDGRAQGFFQNLFGIGNNAPSPSVSRPVIPPSYRAPIIPPPRPRPAEEREADDLPLFGNYRTVCVRMCDGYYFPISTSVSRRAFSRDAGLCRAGCGKEAVLFVSPVSSSDAHDLIDLTGRAYSRLPNAFRYRKTLVDGCKCKPEPWAQSELDRHKTYAVEAAMAAKAAATVAASGVAEPASTGAKVVSASPAPTDMATTLANQAAAPATGDKVSAKPQPPTDDAKPGISARARRTAGATQPAARKSAPKPGPTSVVASSQRPRQPIKTAPFALGGGTLRWPGD